MNKHPLRTVTAADIDTYASQGAVCLRGVFDREWIDLLLDASIRRVEEAKRLASRATSEPTVRGERLEWTLGRGVRVHKSPFFKHMWHDIPAFRAYVFDSPAGEVTARVLGSKAIRFFYDELFYKEPNAVTPTAWHTDRNGWPVRGLMVPSTWMPLTPVDQHSGLEVIAESHTQDVPYWNLTNNSVKMLRPPDRVAFPDCESWRRDPNVKFLSWDMEPGDLLIIHPWALHSSRGSPGAAARFALSTRWFGDDVTWWPRPECVNTRGVSFDEMVEGERPSGPHFPLVWSANGESEECGLPRLGSS